MRRTDIFPIVRIRAIERNRIETRMDSNWGIRRSRSMRDSVSKRIWPFKFEVEVSGEKTLSVHSLPNWSVSKGMGLLRS